MLFLYICCQILLKPAIQNSYEITNCVNIRAVGKLQAAVLLIN